MESSSPFFSVIIPVYNKEKVVARAINSVLQQSFDDYEIIIVMDPSTDSSSAVVKSFNDPRIKLYERGEPGPGGYAARNMGMRNSAGKWIVFLDADDEWTQDNLSEHCRLIEKSDASIVCTSWMVFDETGLISEPRPIEERYMSSEQFYAAYAFEARLINTNTIAFRRNVFLRAGGFPEGRYSRGGDVATWIKFVHYSGSIYCSSLETAIYHTEDSTVTKLISPSVINNAVFEQCASIINTPDVSASSCVDLKKLSNRHIKYGLSAKAKNGNLSIFDLENYYFTVSPFSFVGYLGLALAPNSLSKFIVAMLLKIKKTLG